MKKSELKEMIKAAFMAEVDLFNPQNTDDIQLDAARAQGSLEEDDVVDPYMAEGYEEDLDEMLARLSEEEAEETVNEAEEEDVKVKVKVKDKEDVDVDAGEEIDAADTDLSADDEEVESANDSIVVDKKIVSLSSLPGDTRKILDTLETLRAQAEEFGDQKFITQVGNTITFFTRDFVVAGDAPNPQGIEENTINEDLTSMVMSALEPESLEALKMMAMKLQTSPQALINGLSGVLAGVTTVATAGKALTSDKFESFIKGIMGKEEEKPEVEEGDESANLEREAELELESLNEVKRIQKLAGIIK